MNPNQTTNSINSTNGMMYSKSSGALLNRLQPQNEVITKPTMTPLNTLRPKALQGSQSATTLSLDTKFSKLQPDYTKNRNLSNSSSAAILTNSPQGKSSTMNSDFNAMETIPFHESKHYGDTYEMTGEHHHRPPSTEMVTFEADRIIVPKSSFLSSINMTQKQLYDLFKVPQTFFYLRVRNNATINFLTGTNLNDLEGQGDGNGSVYDLEIISLDQVDKNAYFTLSKEGVTQFRNKVSQFTALTQWEREFKLFHKIANINFFKVYKRWKVSSIYPLYP